MVKYIVIVFIFFSLVSCQKKKVSNDADLYKYSILDANLGKYKLVQFYHSNKSISNIGYIDLNNNKRISELFNFDLNGLLERYSVFDKNSNEKFSFSYKDKSVISKTGEMKGTLDSVCINNRNEYLLFFSYPRLPYYIIKPTIFYIYEDGSEPDTVIPELKGNCFFIVNTKKTIPKNIEFQVEYKHLYRTLDFSTGNVFNTDTIKIVNSNYDDWFYFRDIDFKKPPF